SWLLASARPGRGRLKATGQRPRPPAARYLRYRLEYRMHQQNIDHGCLVDDERVAVEGVPAIAPQPPDGLLAAQWRARSRRRNSGLGYDFVSGPGPCAGGSVLATCGINFISEDKELSCASLVRRPNEGRNGTSTNAGRIGSQHLGSVQSEWSESKSGPDARDRRSKVPQSDQCQSGGFHLGPSAGRGYGVGRTHGSG